MFFLIFFTTLVSLYYCITFNAVSDLESFLTKEQFTISLIESNLQGEIQGDSEFRTAVLKYKNLIVKNSTKGDLDNPVFFYRLMKNVCRSWKRVESLKNDKNSAFLDFVKKYRKSVSLELPTEKDLSEFRHILIRLKDFYRLNQNDLIHGRVDRKIRTTNITLDAEDCFEISKIYFNNNDYHNALLWVEQSVNREKFRQSLDNSDLLNYLKTVLLKLGKMDKAVKMLAEYKEKQQQNEGGIYGYLMTLDLSIDNSTLESDDINQMYSLFGPTSVIYNSLCNGETHETSRFTSTLMCFYKRDRPFLRLAPLKVETLSRKPEIYLFHNVISDAEIELIQQLSLPKFTTGGVFDAVQGATVRNSARSASYVGWLYDTDHERIWAIDRRTEDMTNLKVVNNAEALQVVNYGFGGHYDVHYDAFRVPEHLDDAKGKKLHDTMVENIANDRIATVIFYLSTPSAGGATVFPESKVALFPTKNDAVLWFNLHKNGDVDRMSLHGGCPLLSGRKWIANKWIKERGQEFVRKCSADSKI